MSNVSKTLGEVIKAERVVKEEAEQELLALQEKLRAANEKMELLQTRKTGSPSSAKQTETHKTGFLSSAQSSQQGDSVV